MNEGLTCTSCGGGLTADDLSCPYCGAATAATFRLKQEGEQQQRRQTEQALKNAAAHLGVVG